MAQTPQPSEMGTWACRAPNDHLFSSSSQAQAIHERYRVLVVSEINPDGRARFPTFEG
jgi:hypothetical protein